MALGSAISLLAATLCLYAIGTVIYNIYFHALSKFPGPRSWSAARLRWCCAFIDGTVHQQIRGLHQRYGDSVRVAPDEISFTDPKAWNDIYGHANSRKFIKDPKAYMRSHESEVDHILIANDADHSRMRRLLAHAFSEKALREQTELVTGHVDLLMTRLKERAGHQLDLVKWYNYATFDIIGDLAFGSDFGCLASSDYHPWVSIIFGAIKAAGQLTIVRRYVPTSIITALLPAWVVQKRRDHEAMTISKVKQRLTQKTDRADFLSYILRHNASDPKGLSEGELIANSNLLILAGSETTATALSGVTYLLLRNPLVLEKLTNQIWNLYKSEEEMTLQALANNEYLNAVLKEGMRMYPPVALGQPRVVTDKQVVIAGHAVPKGTTVSVANWASHYSPSNFSSPTTFDPSRWERADTEGSAAPAEKKNTAEAAGRVHRAQAYNPFSIGPRNCIGQNLAWMELRLILARMLWNFDLELLDNGFEPEQQEVYVLWSKPALNVKVTLRSL